MLKNLFSKKKQEKPPTNFLVILADDLGFGDLGCYGSRQIQTPNIDALAEEGVRFTSYYSGSVTCTGGRAALLTGCYPQRVGLGSKNIPPGALTGLNPEEPNIAKMLGGAGYVTGYVGKWALGSNPMFNPIQQGFDYFFGVPFSHSYLDPEVEDHIYLTSNLPLMDGEEELEDETDPSELTPRLMEQAAEFMESAGDNPFCLILSHLIPHRPLLPMENFEGGSKIGIYGDTVQELDWSVGTMIEILKQIGKYEDTLVVFASDNGPAIVDEHSSGYIGGTGRPWRGGKGQTLEGGIRVPCIARLPGQTLEGHVWKEITCGMDWLPTFAGLADIKLDKKQDCDGEDIWPFMSIDNSEALWEKDLLARNEKNEQKPRDEFYYYKEGRLQCVRKGAWKLLMYRSNWDIEKPEQKDYVLFNLDNDRLEESNLADQHPDIVDELSKIADKVRRDLGDTIHKKKGRGTRSCGEVAMA